MSEVTRIEAAVNASRGDKPYVSLINQEEHTRIVELIDANTWPQGWTGEEPNADETLPFHYGRRGNVKQFLLPLPLNSEEER